ERESVRPGRCIGEFTIAGRRILVLVCADFWFADVILGATALPDLMLVPALSVTRKPTPAYSRALWRHLAVSRAYEYGVYVGLRAQPPAPVGFVVLIVALEPHRPALALEGQDVGGDAVEEPAVVADDHRAAREVDERVLHGAQRVDVEVIGRLVEQQHVAAAAQQLGEVHAVPLAAGEVLHLLLLVRAREVEERGVGSRVHLAFADQDGLPAAVGELLPHGALAVEGLAALVDVGEDHRLAEAERAGVGLLLADDHAEERRLAG